MNEAELDALMAQSTQHFNQLKVEEGTVRERLNQIDTGLKNIQGEYAAYETIKKGLVERREMVENTTPQVDPASLTPDPRRSAVMAKAESKKETANAAK